MRRLIAWSTRGSASGSVAGVSTYEACIYANRNIFSASRSSFAQAENFGSRRFENAGSLREEVRRRPHCREKPYLWLNRYAALSYSWTSSSVLVHWCRTRRSGRLRSGPLCGVGVGW